MGTGAAMTTRDFSTAEPLLDSARLDAVITEKMRELSLPGALVGVWRDGYAPLTRAFGVRDTATGEAMTTDLHVRIGSLTKSFTATAILELVDEGRVALDDAVSTYVSGVPNGDAITLRQLAAMRSGLWDYSEEVIPANLVEPTRHWTPRELLDIGFSRPPLFSPGTAFDYSNTNTVLLALVVEAVSGQSLDVLVAERILQPMNLTHTGSATDTAMAAPYAHGYAPGPEGATVDATFWNPSWGFGAGNMFSTLDDVGTWARGVATGTLLSSAAQAARLEFLPAPSEGDGALYGLALEYQNGWIGHNGNIAGYLTYAYYLPEQLTTLVMSVNSNVEVIGVWEMFSDIVGVVSPNHPWPGIPV
jgi:D-alanyl-D-alanine carboxypeptidase